MSYKSTLVLKPQTQLKISCLDLQHHLPPVHLEPRAKSQGARHLVLKPFGFPPYTSARVWSLDRSQKIRVSEILVLKIRRFPISMKKPQSASRLFCGSLQPLGWHPQRQWCPRGSHLGASGETRDDAKSCGPGLGFVTEHKEPGSWQIAAARSDCAEPENSERIRTPQSGSWSGAAVRLQECSRLSMCGISMWERGWRYEEP